MKTLIPISDCENKIYRVQPSLQALGGIKQSLIS